MEPLRLLAQPDPITLPMWIWPVIYGIIGVFVILILIAIVRRFLFICPPNEVLIFSGRTYRMPDGTRRGFNVVFGGTGWRTPIIGKVDRMSLNTMEVPITVRNVYSKGGIPLHVDAIANIKISSDSRVVGNAIERFLGRDPNEIRRVAKETLEGHLRGTLATLTPEEVNEDRLMFAEALSRESEEDLSKLGLHVDTLKIQHVADDMGYLDATGRRAIANVIREAEIAESNSKRAAEQAEAENQGRANVIKANVEANIARMTNDLRRIQAELESEVRSQEERTAAAAREARATAEQELQKVRAELATIQLQSDTILPAEAERQAREFRARGDAAVIRERGKAVAEALELLNHAWREAGPTALQIALIEDIEKILASAAAGVTKVKIDGIQIVDSGDGATLANYVGNYPAMLDTVFAAIEKTTGIDIPGTISGQEKQK
ncbi:MAG TPA: SPFH domain-containing protein [Fimbriimonadaceae bacterium]|nr:SPFH domain-containing protein [Fimbriimonadaceae bacterium]HRJ95675.1 SPFH domain-containing protein [Fimbriimonadaceae bacterium]